MDHDSLSSFEETSFNKGQKFIALVVSDVSDLDDSFSNDNNNTNNHTINSTVANTTNTNRYSKLISTPSKQIKRSSFTANTTNNSITNSNRKTKNDDKKRWSFISNHSSSSKKRWSNFTVDSVTNSNNITSSNVIIGKNNKRLSMSSNISIHNTPKKNILHNTTNIVNNTSNNNNCNTNTNDIDSIHSKTRSIENSSKSGLQSELKTPLKKQSHNKTNSVTFINTGNSNSNHSIHSNKPNSNTPSKSMKRSSTGSSLRQFLNKIVTNNDNDNNHEISSQNEKRNINNTHSDLNDNKENIKPINENFNSLHNQHHNHHNQHHHQKSTTSDLINGRSITVNSKVTTPVTTPTTKAKMNRSRLLHSKSHSQISDHFINTANMNNTAEDLRSNNYININSNINNSNISNFENFNKLNNSMDNLSLHSKRTSVSSTSSINSKPKWKFWKKNSNSSSHNNNSANKRDEISIYNKTNNSNNTNNNNANMERTISTYSHETQKLRSKNSLSDFHQSSFYNNSISHQIATTPMTTPSSSSIISNKNNFHYSFNNNNNTSSSFHDSPMNSFTNNNDIYTNSNHIINSNNINNNNNNNSNNIPNSSVKKRTSTQSLSISQLKHRSSQQSLKHKTSHSSLQKFTTRRKSITDDVSSFLTLASSIHSGHSSNNGNNGTNGNNQISLPIPNQVSRDKIRTKLKNSTSLLSLNSALPMNKKIYDETMLNNLLELCTVKCVIDFDELDASKFSHLETLSKNHSVQLSNKVWRATSSIDNSQTIICKKISLTNEDNNTIMRELNILNIVSGTPGMPQLLQCYILQDSNQEKFIHIFLKDNGDPLSEIDVTSWSQCLKYFWQCVNILYVMETKFQFEHRNLTLNHILVDKNGNITLCDLSTSRITCPNEKNLFSRLDHPIFFQGGTDYLFDTYNLMRSIFIHRNEQWDKFEPITNLIWLRYLLILVLLKNKDKTLMGPGREQLTRLMSVLECNISHSNKRSPHIFNKRKDIEVKACGDLLRIK